MKNKYEKKIKVLISHIQKLKKNSKFFNYNLDHDIMDTN